MTDAQREPLSKGEYMCIYTYIYIRTYYMLCCGPVKVPGIMILTHSGANLKVAHMAEKRGEEEVVRGTGWIHT